MGLLLIIEAQEMPLGKDCMMVSSQFASGAGPDFFAIRSLAEPNQC
jgi:hypothetical protein